MADDLLGRGGGSYIISTKLKARGTYFSEHFYIGLG